MRLLTVAGCILPSPPPPPPPPLPPAVPSKSRTLTPGPGARCEGEQERAIAAWSSARRPGCCCPCPCGRRHLLVASAAALLPTPTLKAWSSDPMDAKQVTADEVHPARPDWYEELYAATLKDGMRTYEAEIAGYKAELFTHLVGKNKNILELGVGTGPNFKYYVRANDLHVIGVDPNKQMERYAREAAVAAGLPSTNFSFVRGVGEAIPVEDNSLDAVIGTLVLCSVKDVDMALREVKRVLKPGGLYLFIEHVGAPDGSLLRFIQNVLDPLQQFVADGCHLTRDTGKNISKAEFTTASIDMVFLSTISLIGPHVYGFAYK